MRLPDCFLPACLFLALSATAQTPAQARYHQVFENDHVLVYTLELPPSHQAPVFQNVHDLVWVALEDSTLTLVPSEGGPYQWRFKAGDTRFLRRYRARLVRNDTQTTFRGVVVEIKARGLETHGCSCSSRVEKAVCGCDSAPPLPQLWALSMGAITLAGTTLDPGQSFQGASSRDDTLLIAVTGLQLRDEAAGGSEPLIQLGPGQVGWIKEGRHRFRNVGVGPARFVTLEF